MHPIKWPARSPDLNLSYFCLWGYMFATKINTVGGVVKDISSKSMYRVYGDNF